MRSGELDIKRCELGMPFFRFAIGPLFKSAIMTGLSINLAIQRAFAKALPGKLEIKRREPGILSLVHSALNR